LRARQGYSSGYRTIGLSGYRTIALSGYRGWGVLIAIVFGTLVTGCTRTPASPTAPSQGSISASDQTADTAFCVDEINRFRSTIGAPPLTQSSAIEAFSTEASRVDGAAHQAHKYFRDTNGGNGVSLAENEIPWWLLSQFSSTRAVITKGLEMEWAEGPGGGHYDTMSGKYTEVACGISITSGEITVTQDFR
jgi:hypothetical protein